MEEEAGSFDALFGALYGRDRAVAPFPWQRALFAEFLAGRFPASCDIPTGLGKTSVIAVWLLALARHVRDGTVSGFPRRLVYVVNRRTVVGQATGQVEGLHHALLTRPELAAVAAPEARSRV